MTPYRSVSGSITLKLEGSFSRADAVQLSLALNVIVRQGRVRTRFDLAGNVFTSVGGRSEHPEPGPGVIGFAQREITLVLPHEFSAGQALAQVVTAYRGESIASNWLSFAL
ncbi:MAG: hypothetical protein ACE5I7_14220 [Candidatus Binatia bacterium]